MRESGAEAGDVGLNGGGIGSIWIFWFYGFEMFDKRAEQVAQYTVVQTGLHRKDTFEVGDVLWVDVTTKELTFGLWDMFVWCNEWHGV